jgi:hypothetical protein
VKCGWSYGTRSIGASFWFRVVRWKRTAERLPVAEDVDQVLAREALVALKSSRGDSIRMQMSAMA